MSVASERLEDVAQVVRGVSFDKAEVSGEPAAGTVPILRAGNISDVLDTGSGLIWVPSARVKAEQRLRPGDIAVCMSSGSQSVVGKSAPLRREWTGSVGAFCAIVRPRPERVEPAYLAFYMRSEGFRTWTRKSEGVNIKNIRHSELLQHSVPVPPPAEQRRIVDLLSRAENIVRMRREAEARAKEIIPALFLDMFGDPARNERGWEFSTLGAAVDTFRYGSSQKSSGSGDPVLRIPNVIAGSINTSDLKFLQAKDADRSRYALASGDILFVRTNGNPDYVGRCAVFHASDDRHWLYASYLIRARPRSDVAHSVYLQAFLSSSQGRRAFRERARTAAGQYNINIDGLKSIPLPLPPLARQQEFAVKKEGFDELLQHSQAATALADRSFQSLLAGVFGEGAT